MALNSVSRGYNSSSRTANHPGAFFDLSSTEFGQVGGAAASLAYNAGAGSLAMSTAHVQITWITANGESLPNTEATVAVSASTGAVTVTQPTVPTNGAAVVGWRVYSSATTATNALQVSALSTTQVQSTFTVSDGKGGTTTLSAFPVATTAVQILIYGAGATVPLYDTSGTQHALPSVGANTSADYYLLIPNSGSLWKVQGAVDFSFPQSAAQTTGVALVGADFVMPLYPGTSTSATQNATYMVLNGYCFLCTVSGTTASTFPGQANFNTTRGVTSTDGSVTWICLGKSGLIRLHYVNATGSAAIPVAQHMDLFQL